MKIDFANARALLAAHDFAALFRREMLWESDAGTIPIAFDGQNYRLEALAHKNRFRVLLLETPTLDALPHSVQIGIDREYAKNGTQHLLIFADAERFVFQWLRVEGGASPTPRRYGPYSRADSFDLLLQKLDALAYSIEDELQLLADGSGGILETVGRVKATFDVEKPTKKFFERFQKEHAAFMGFIRGVEGRVKEEYASLMLNRLMFLYFMQSKGFLCGETGNDRPENSYLYARLLDKKQRAAGESDYYRGFLCPLFFDGLARPLDARSDDVKALLGQIPYLNGGLFTRSQLEKDHSIAIEDGAFRRLFDFFAEFSWHLDERTLRKQNEINPDVLGYVFERYINNKQMGAYYTKEDITGYIAKNTVLPWLFEQTAWQNDWPFQTLAARGDAYLYPALLRGMETELPPEIAAGISDISARTLWNRAARAPFALPTETWREVVARRARVQSLRQTLQNGEISRVSDLITHNLDIVAWFGDLILDINAPAELWSLWNALKGVSVLDPTCGSGAFLFAAINILEPVYNGVLQRMKEFVEDFDRRQLAHDGRLAASEEIKGFRAVLDEIASHPNRDYFIIKTLVVNNLYGVDIMAEATEICKLRLFLKLAAQVEPQPEKPNYGIEPLPDIDFNIRAGNTLVGFARREEVKSFGALFNADAIAEIEQKADECAAKLALFREAQKNTASTIALADSKVELQDSLKWMGSKLNAFLAHEYNFKITQDAERLHEWEQSHQPFHWWIEFHDIIERGGFDVIIGNPPWKEYAAVKKDYQVKGYTTESSGNLYALCIERIAKLSCQNTFQGLIVQLPLVCSSRMMSARELLMENNKIVFVLPFDDRPGKLFEGLQNCRSVIYLAQSIKEKKIKQATLQTSAYKRWSTSARLNLFDKLHYVNVNDEKLLHGQFPKFAETEHENALAEIQKVDGLIGTVVSQRETPNFIFYQEATRYWIKATIGLPHYAKNKQIGAPAHGRFLYFNDPNRCAAVSAIMNSSLFYAFFVAYSDCFHVNDGLVNRFPISLGIIEDEQLSKLGAKLMENLTANADIKTINTRDGDEIVYAEFFGAKSKPIIDEIDRVLASHYGFSDEELDFIINYDIKYRMGRDAEGE